MSDEELIEKAAKAIHDAHVPVEGTEVPPWDRESDAWRETYRDFARAALAVFREHTAVEGSANLPQNSEHTAPTTDEAEALGGLSELIGEYMPGADGYLDARAIAVGILAQFQLVRRGEADRCQECRETEALKENFHLVMKENSDLRRAALERGAPAEPAVTNERVEAEGEDVFLIRYGIYHASFGGIGGDAIRLDITREAWKEMGEPRSLKASWAALEVEEGEEIQI